MKLSHFDLESPIFLDSEFIHVLVIESPKLFYKITKEIYMQINGEDGRFILSEKEKALSFSKNAYLFHDYFSLQINDKKIITALYKDLEKLQQDNFISEFSIMQENIISLFEKINSESRFAIDYDEDTGFSEILKAFNVKFEENTGSFLENLVEYIKILIAVSSVKCLFFVNLKSYLSEEELKMFYKEMQLSDISILLIEDCQREKIEDEKILIIDKDLCEIVV